MIKAVEHAYVPAELLQLCLFVHNWASQTDKHVAPVFAILYLVCRTYEAEARTGDPFLNCPVVKFLQCLIEGDKLPCLVA